MAQLVDFPEISRDPPNYRAPAGINSPLACSVKPDLCPVHGSMVYPCGASESLHLRLRARCYADGANWKIPGDALGQHDRMVMSAALRNSYKSHSPSGCDDPLSS